jgi:ribosomal protein S18 acetylase RimI-like enzyme
VSGAPLRSTGDAPAAPPRSHFRPHFRPHFHPHFRAHFRAAGPDDVEAVARVHFEAAQQAYRDVLPDGAMAGAMAGAKVGMTYQRRLALWGGLLGSPGDRPRVELAVDPCGADPDEVVAFAWWRKAKDPEVTFGGEIHALYVLPQRQRQGFGRRLMAHTARRMAGTGLESCRLWVFEQNRAARRFYRALGGHLIDRGWETLGERRVPRVAYAWDPIDRLMTQGDSPVGMAAP